MATYAIYYCDEVCSLIRQNSIVEVVIVVRVMIVTVPSLILQSIGMKVWSDPFDRPKDDNKRS